jgi:hypothetical protein
LRLETPHSEEDIIRFLERRSGTFDLFGKVAWGVLTEAEAKKKAA